MVVLLGGGKVQEVRKQGPFRGSEFSEACSLRLYLSLNAFPYVLSVSVLVRFSVATMKHHDKKASWR